MNREKIVEWAKEVGFFMYDLTETHGVKTVESDESDQWTQLERFALLVAEAEREECAVVCEELAELNRKSPTDSMWQQGECAAAIRALGERT